MKNQVLATLIRGRDIFAARGGAKRALMNGYGQVCANGAICVADLEASGRRVPERGPIFWSDVDPGMTCNRSSDHAAMALYAVAVEQHGTSAVTFNNRDSTTLDDVLALFDKAIGRLEEQA